MCVSKLRIVIAGYGKEGKYFWKASSSWSFPFSNNCKIAVDVNVLVIDAILKDEVSKIHGKKKKNKKMLNSTNFSFIIQTIALSMKTYTPKQYEKIVEKNN